MPRGCTPRAACGGTCQDTEHHVEAMAWYRYWNALTPEEQQRKRESMAQYVAEHIGDET